MVIENMPRRRKSRKKKKKVIQKLKKALLYSFIAYIVTFLVTWNPVAGLIVAIPVFVVYMLYKEEIEEEAKLFKEFIEEEIED